MNENKYQQELKKKIKERIPGCIILKNDANWLQGFPDFTILYGDRWATLEIKKDGASKHQPNQEYYVELTNEMSYSSFIFPENEQEVLDELQRSLRAGRPTRVPKS